MLAEDCGAGTKRYAAGGVGLAPVSGGGRKVWYSVKNLTGKVFAGCGRKTVADWRKMSGVAVLSAGAG